MRRDARYTSRRFGDGPTEPAASRHLGLIALSSIHSYTLSSGGSPVNAAAPIGWGVALDAEHARGAPGGRGGGRGDRRGRRGAGCRVAVARVRGDLQPRAQSQLLQDAVHVALDRAGSDAEALGDLLVAQAIRNQIDDLAL